ncbi:acyltransferase family protein [Ekhidna sp.]|uniref:acyltransferase family protein n=1 Tax=Ekhidna sp. TaxID=2608089 RepID=UPI003B50B477
MTNISNSKRIHSLDALRAIMMLLGIVLHSSETYSIGVDLLWPKDPNSTSHFFTYLSAMIHIFRMPTFFLISGFFGAMLFYERSPRVMIKQRLKRIVLPFVIFLLILHPVIYHSYEFMIDSFELEAFADIPFRWFPNITYHLWFLYYLIMITATTVLVATLLRHTSHINSVINKSFKWLLERQLLFICLLSIVIFILLVWMWDYWASTPLTFMPNIKIIIFYSVFYLFGWVLFKSKNILGVFMKYDRPFLLFATALFTLKFIFSDHIDDIIYGGLNTIICWCFVFGFMGLFLRYFNTHSDFGRYLSDSSYWVYLVHLPFTLIIPALIGDLNIHVGLKFALVLTGTTTLCYVTYHYMVRATFIGQFLNGRKYN